MYLMGAAADQQTARATAPLLRDDSPLLRAAAIRPQRAAPPQEQFQNLLDLLSDPIRLVRLSAAPDLLRAPVASLPPRIAERFGRVAGEWQRSLGNRLDFPETHLVLGGTALTMRNTPAAIGAFREAVTQDPQLLDAWVMLVRLEASTNGAEAASAVVEEALQANPGQPDLMAMQRELQQ